MPPTGPAERSAARRAFSLAIAAYVVVWAGVCVFASREFGVRMTITLSWFLVLPFLVAVRMRRQWDTVRRRDFALLFVLLVVVSGGGSAFAIWRCYDLGVHDAHVRDAKFAELTRAVGKDPAFCSVKLKSIPFKALSPIYQIQGTVASKSDLDRLESLCQQHGFSFHAKDVSVAGVSEGEGKQ